jgi:hypothetical protein
VSGSKTMVVYPAKSYNSAVEVTVDAVLFERDEAAGKRVSTLTASLP